MPVSKIIKFQYFRVVFHDGEKRERYDLGNWINCMIDFNLAERIAEIKGYPSRLESEHIMERDDDFVHLRFIKMTNAFIPSKAFDDQEIEPIDLDDDEYIAVDVNTIYDVKSQTLMIQINRGSLSVDRIKDYINFTAMKNNLFDDGEFITLEPIYNNFDIKTLKHKKYRQIEFSFDSTQGYSGMGDNNGIDAYLHTLDKCGGKIGYIRFGMGHSSKENGMNEEEINNLIDLIKENENFRKANVVYIDDNDNSYKYDLFEKNILTDKMKFVIEPRTCLSSIKVRNTMLSFFQKRLSTVRG